jgi:hypothetical protein
MATHRTLPIVDFAAIRRSPITLGEQQRRQAFAQPTKVTMAKRREAVREALAAIEAALHSTSPRAGTSSASIRKVAGLESTDLGALLKSRVRSV